ncbi:uncharacterized protein LY89DRAFT_688729 [Mollisia scopiformis]|uniref:DUF8021 domain-containing protein n=1 Tax=Mollisia scopiformis TaxID=149040 RepID=A0A194WV00_MOLSC|nr:uncharacterized protein LY89DRAFT_688729 [Mollisia scopiformis]KUJ11489.1 hypothetical protein LY89DRAFT_688729 [Mollisia scopiformis]
MSSKFPYALLLGYLMLALVSAQNATCDRSCLEGLISNYLTALTTHNSSLLTTTPNVKYVENDQIVPFGAGEWHVSTTLGKYRHIFSDPNAGQVAAITTIVENGVGAIYVVRLKVEKNQTISEIETAITRDPGGAARYENMTKPEAVWLQAVPQAQRVSRATLIARGNMYYSGMERNDPKGNYSFFSKDCLRIEDGLQTTEVKTGDAYGHSNDTVFASLSCEEQFQSGFLGFVTAVRERHFSVVDEERQAVFVVSTIDQNGTVRWLPDVNGTSSPIPAYFDVPRGEQGMEAFQVRDDKLFRIEMTMIEVPYGMRAAFHIGSPVDLRGSGTNKTIASPCDDSCLKNVLKQVLQAMQNHDASALPLAQGVRYSENGQFLSLSDGLWGTLGHFDAPGQDDYGASFVDSAKGVVGYWGATKEQSTPGVLVLRVQVEGGKITEIEAIDVRAESSGARFGTLTLMRPPLPIEWESTPLGRLDSAFKQNSNTSTGIPSVLVSAYFDGLERHSSAGVSFTTGCVRRDMTVQGNLSCAAQMDGRGAAPNGLFNGTISVRDRRILVADAKAGVALAVVLIDYPAASPPPLPATQLVPSTYMVPQLIKIDNGSISRVESMIKWMPFGYVSSWAEEKVS